MLEKANLASKIPVYLKLNTGMNRLGFSPEDLRARSAPGFADERHHPHDHFADADGKRGVKWQVDRFQQASSGLSFSRSLAKFRRDSSLPGKRHADWVRPGIMLYGCSPFSDESAEKLGLKPVMTLSSELIAVRSLSAGDSVGYGCTFTANGPMRIGIVACGYATAYPRHAPIGTPILVCGKPRPHRRPRGDGHAFRRPDRDPGGRRRSPVTLWGEGLSADEVAASAAP